MEDLSNLELKQRNRNISNKEFEEGANILSSYPRALFIELTQDCNCYCLMCRRATNSYRNRKMPLELFKRIADELFPHAEIIDLRGWGESLILSDFKKYVDYAAKFQSKLRIVTNLSIENPKIIEYLRKQKFLVEISFDSATQEIYEAIRRGAKFATVVDNIQKLCSKCKDGDATKNNTTLIVTVQEMNINEIEKIVRFAGEKGISLIKLAPVDCSIESNMNLEHHYVRVKRMLKNVYHLAETLNITVQLTASLHSRLTSCNYAKKRCIHPWMYCYIDYDGNVGLCDHLIGQDNEQYLGGNLQKLGFKEIWNGKVFYEVRVNHTRLVEGNRSLLFNACNWCYKYRYIDFEHLLVPDLSKYIISNNKDVHNI